MALKMFIVKRFINHDDFTIAEFFDKSNSANKFYLLELPWKNNEKNISCIPKGIYIVERDFYHKGGYEAFEYRDVIDRSEIKIHIGNYTKDILGCQAIGTHYSVTEKMVYRSRIAHLRFMQYMQAINKFIVEII